MQIKPYLIEFDFEYRKSYEEQMQVICVAWRKIDLESKTVYPVEALWLDGVSPKNRFTNFLLQHKSSSILLSFNTSAEARALHSLGINPREFDWIDVHLEWKIATNNHLDFMYGTISKGNGKYIESFGIAERPEASHEKVGTGLAAMTLKLLGIDIDSTLKNHVRGLILYRTSWQEHEKKKILEYCKSDVSYLWQCLKKMPQFSFETFWEDALCRGRWGVNLALIEARGIPINLDAVFSFAASYDEIKDILVKECNEHYPFFIRKKIKGKVQWTQSYAQFLAFVCSKGLVDMWPRTQPTDSGVGQQSKLSTADETLKEFSGIPEIQTLRKTLTIIRQAKWYRPDALPDFLQRVGSDSRVRPYFNALGTATGRNAPPAKTFLFAQSKWTRSLITPPPGMAISGIDYSSQEFAVAAALSNDRAMIAAYNSGDPYLWFAKEARAVPLTATRQTHEHERELFKSTALAVQFGMGGKSLALVIAANTGKAPDVEQAYELLQMHRDVFWRYYEWLDEMEMDFRRRGFIRLIDGHTLWLSNDREKNILSVRNHPVQGTGATILRYAVDFAMEAGLKVIAPMHDAIYHEHSIEETLRVNTILKGCMDRAVYKVFGSKIKIRNDVKTVRHGELWIEKQAEKDYDLMKRYLNCDEGVLIKMALFDGRN